MATKFEYEQTFPASPQAVLAMLHDSEYVELRCEKTGSLKTTVDITGDPGGECTVSSTRILPADVPAAAKSFVGDTLKVNETQAWSAPSADGSATAVLTVDFGGPLAFSGRMELSGDAASTKVRTTGEFKASMPFIGGKIEKIAADQTERYLRTEQSVGTTWLSSH